MSEMRLFNADGNRLYLTQSERQAFLDVARLERPEVRTFAETLAYTGCRISEALGLVPKRVALDECRIVLRSLKKRREDVYRAVPVPPEYIDTLDMVHRIRKSQKSKKTANQCLWSWTRQHVTTEIIKPLMIKAGIPEGAHRTSKGLRHAYGVNAVTRNIPLNMLQKWMGHADMKTTAIYANAVDEEEAGLAAKMWE